MSNGGDFRFTRTSDTHKTPNTNGGDYQFTQPSAPASAPYDPSRRSLTDWQERAQQAQQPVWTQATPRQLNAQQVSASAAEGAAQGAAVGALVGLAAVKLFTALKRRFTA